MLFPTSGILYYPQEHTAGILFGGLVTACLIIKDGQLFIPLKSDEVYEIEKFWWVNAVSGWRQIDLWHLNRSHLSWEASMSSSILLSPM